MNVNGFLIRNISHSPTISVFNGKGKKIENQLKRLFKITNPYFHSLPFLIPITLTPRHNGGELHNRACHLKILSHHLITSPLHSFSIPRQVLKMNA